MKRVAYDYGKQEWTEGDRARRLLVQQMEEDIAILHNPTCWKMMGETEKSARVRTQRCIKFKEEVESELLENQPCRVTITVASSVLNTTYPNMAAAIRALDPFQVEDRHGFGDELFSDRGGE